MRGVIIKELGIDIFNLDEKINDTEYILIEFYTTWCGPCKLLNSVLEKIDNYFDKLMIIKVNLENNLLLKEKYEIDYMPTLLYIKNGIIVDKSEGYLTEPYIIKNIQERLGIYGKKEFL